MQFLANYIEIVVFLTLLVLGYGAGRWAERRHYRSIIAREREMGDLVIIAGKTVPDDVRISNSQLVMGSAVISVDYFKRFVANLRMIFGGRVHTYESLLDRARREALLRMQDQAREIGGRVIFNTRFETSSISKGQKQSIGAVEVLAYGTALVP